MGIKYIDENFWNIVVYNGVGGRRIFLGSVKMNEEGVARVLQYRAKGHRVVLLDKDFKAIIPEEMELSPLEAFF